jgi:8-hydroxy-5-deazaflavin:NADPH oxidoreductase
MRIGIIGAGMIGSTLSKLWVDAGHDVRLASRHPDNLLPLIQKLGKARVHRHSGGIRAIW